MAATFGAIATTTPAVFIAGPGIAGAGFGLAFVGAFGMVLALASTASRLTCATGGGSAAREAATTDRSAKENSRCRTARGITVRPWPALTDAALMPARRVADGLIEPSRANARWPERGYLFPYLPEKPGYHKPDLPDRAVPDRQAKSGRHDHPRRYP